MKQQAQTTPQHKKFPKPLKIVLICVAGAIALFGIVFAIDRLAFNGTLFSRQDNSHHDSREIPEYCKGNVGKEDCWKYLDVYKPIIYLYPEEETEISVKLGSPEKLTTVYPKYNNGWHVLAEPNGKLTDLSTGRELYALYWEGKDATYHQTAEGFVVKGSDTASFLEEKLAILGLNYKEAEEFIVYWLPKLEKNSYNYIRFASSEEINIYMSLSVTPQPDTTIRIMMIWRSLDKPIDVTEQKLETPTRTGFTVVEWGGSEL